jgi:hypothetical protein
LTDVAVGVIPHSNLRPLVENHPGIGLRVAWMVVPGFGVDFLVSDAIAGPLGAPAGFVDARAVSALTATRSPALKVPNHEKFQRLIIRVKIETWPQSYPLAG